MVKRFRSTVVRDSAAARGVAPRWRVHAAWALIAVVAVAATWFAASAILAPATDPVAEPPPATYTVSPGAIGIDESGQGAVSFNDTRVVASQTGGTVTSISDGLADGVDAGATLLAVDLRPVVAGQGDTPSFRDLSLGTRGTDVAQLRALLGLPASDAFDARTERAVRQWQRELGVPVDGVVRAGDVVYVPSLPARIRIVDEVSVGSILAPGTPVLAVLDARPVVEVIADNSGRFSSGMAASVVLPDTDIVIEGVLEGPYASEDGLDRFRLVDAEGEPACSDACASALPAAASTQVQVEVETVPNEVGLVVPDAALVTQPDGTMALRDPAGALLPVEVIASAGGLSIVSGVDEGTVVLLFGDGS